MADLTEQAQWENGIYQLETTDPVVGGPDGVDNRQAKELANRTVWLKQEMEKKLDGNNGSALTVGSQMQNMTATRQGYLTYTNTTNLLLICVVYPSYKNTLNPIVYVDGDNVFSSLNPRDTIIFFVPPGSHYQINHKLELYRWWEYR